MFSGRVFAAMMLGACIGLERQRHSHPAGLRTNTLVSVGSALFVVIPYLTGGDSSPTRVAGQVVSGIGFLGAGVILREGLNVRGLNTAATLWCSAAVGGCTGSNMVVEGALLTIFVIAGNTLLRPLVNAINRIPLNEQR